MARFSSRFRVAVVDQKQHKRPQGSERSGSDVRKTAIEAIVRIESSGAYANLIVPHFLDSSELDQRDKNMVTELVYGSTRMRRACDYLADRFITRALEPRIRAALRIGVYQLVFMGTPPHAALDATVGAVDSPGRKLVNAVLRRVASAEVAYPDLATQLSYPDWIFELFVDTFGEEEALRSLTAMNEPATTHRRSDGYVQDVASQMVVEQIDVGEGDVVIDLCAAPGGKATALAGKGAVVVANDRRLSRAKLLAQNIDAQNGNAQYVDACDVDEQIVGTENIDGQHLGFQKADAHSVDVHSVDVQSFDVQSFDVQNAGNSRAVTLPVVSDGLAPGFRSGKADHVLVDAPCSGLGSLRRRPDARWRIERADLPALGKLQLDLLRTAVDLVRPGGQVTYSVCTFGRDECEDVVNNFRAEADVSQLPPPGDPWRLSVGVAQLLPDATDGMSLAQFRRRV